MIALTSTRACAVRRQSMARVATHPHAVQSIAGIPGMFSYDDNGNQSAAPMAAARQRELGEV